MLWLGFGEPESSHRVRCLYFGAALKGKGMRKKANLSRENIARNITVCRKIKHPGRGGQRECAEAFGVLPQQWSPWERGIRTPTGTRLNRICEYFGITAEWLNKNHGPTTEDVKRAYLKLITPSTVSNSQPSKPLSSNVTKNKKIQSLLSEAIQSLDAYQPDLLAYIGQTLSIPKSISIQIHIQISSKSKTDKAKKQKEVPE